MYREAVDSAYEHLIRPVGVVPGRDDLTLIGTVQLGKWQPSLQHLTCFAGGMCVTSSSPRLDAACSRSLDVEHTG